MITQLFLRQHLRLLCAHNTYGSGPAQRKTRQAATSCKCLRSKKIKYMNPEPWKLELCVNSTYAGASERLR